MDSGSSSTKKLNAACKLCPRKFYHTSSLHAHMKKEHQDVLKDTIDDISDVMHKCQVCDHCFDTVEDLNFHSLTHIDDNDLRQEASRSEGGDFECQYCSERFSSEDHLNYHVITHQVSTEEGEKEYVGAELAPDGMVDENMESDHIGCDDYDAYGISYDDPYGDEDDDNDDYDDEAADVDIE